MRAIQRINNNVVLVTTDTGKAVVMGNGVGFNVYPKDIIPSAKVERTFILQDDIQIDNFVSLLNNVPMEIIEMTHNIIKVAELSLDTSLNANLIVTLSDHIHFAFQRAEQNIQVEHPLYWEIKHVYAKEFKFAAIALEMINQHAEIRLPKEEQAFIAMHLVNAQQNVVDIGRAIESVAIINEILDIINYHFQKKIDDESLNLSRFVSHLRFFLLRQSIGTKKITEVDEQLYTTVKKKYEKETACVEKVSNYLEQLHGWNIEKNEKLYLTLHISRLMNENNI